MVATRTRSVGQKHLSKSDCIFLEDWTPLPPERLLRVFPRTEIAERDPDTHDSQRDKDVYNLGHAANRRFAELLGVNFNTFFGEPSVPARVFSLREIAEIAKESGLARDMSDALKIARRAVKMGLRVGKCEGRIVTLSHNSMIGLHCKFGEVISPDGKVRYKLTSGYDVFELKALDLMAG